MNTQEEINLADQQVDQPKSFMGEAFKLSVVWAIISIIIFLLTWYAFPKLMVNPAYGIVSILISIGLAVYFTLSLRKKVGGYWDFRMALRHIFVLFLVQIIISTAFTAVFAKFIEPNYANFMRENMLNSMTELYENMGMQTEQVDEMIAQLEVSLEQQLDPSFGDFLKNLGVISIFYFIGALIFAAIFKRSRPVFAPINDQDDYSYEK